MRNTSARSVHGALVFPLVILLGLSGCDTGGGIAQGSAFEVHGESDTYFGLGPPGGLPFHFGFDRLENKSNSTVVMRAPVPRPFDAGLTIVGFRIMNLGENDAQLGSLCDPFPTDSFKTHPVDGYRVKPGDAVSIVISFAAKSVGMFKFHGFKLVYEQDGRLFHQDVRMEIEIEAREGVPCNEDKTTHATVAASQPALQISPFE